MSGSRPNPFSGLIRVAFGRADGLAEFGRTASSYLNSLAPLLAFPLAGAIIELFRDGPVSALRLALLAVVLQLSPAVLSQAIAQWWKRDDRWLHFATAYNWCYWALPAVAFLLMLLLALAISAGVSQDAAAKGFLLGLGGYSLWLHWFLARHALDLSRGRAALLVLMVNAGVIVLAIAPAQFG